MDARGGFAVEWGGREWHGGSLGQNVVQQLLDKVDQQQFVLEQGVVIDGGLHRSVSQNDFVINFNQVPHPLLINSTHNLSGLIDCIQRF